MNKKLFTILGLLFIALIGFHIYTQPSYGAPLTFISAPATTTSAGDFGFTIGTTTPLTGFGSTTLAVYGSTTIQTRIDTLRAFEVLNAASTSIFRIDTANTRASTSALVISNLGNTGTECLRITNQGVVQTTGAACVSTGANVPDEFTYNQGLVGIGGRYLTPTSTVVGLLTTDSASSTLMRLTSRISTSTQATTTNFAISTITSAIPITAADGSFSEYAGTSCTNQFVRSLSVLGAATCATVVGTDVNLEDLTATNGTLTFSGAYDGQTARTIGINLGNANTWTALQTINDLVSTRSTSTSATSTNLAVSSSLIVPAVASSSVIQSGEIGVQTNDNTLHYNSGGTTRSLTGTSSVVIIVASTTAAENMFAFRVPSKFTATHIFAKTDMPYVSAGTATTVGTTFNIAHGRDKNLTTNIFSASLNTTPTGTNTGTSSLTSFCPSGCTVTTSFSDATFAMGEEVFITTSAASSSLHNIHVQIEGFKTP